MLKFRALIILTLASILSSCGGGSDSSATVTPSPPNQAPVADAGADQSVNEGATVELSGSGTDSDGNIVSYSWLQEAGTVVTITNADQANASFVAPTVSASEILLFRLTVADDDGADGSDTVSVTVNNVPIPPPPPPNQAPTANAGGDQTVDEGATVSLSGTGTDSDGNIEAYSWQQISGLGVVITNAGMANASFTAPNVEATQDLIFRLTVTDDDGASGSDTVTITVNDTAPSNNAPLVTVDQPEDGATFDSNETIVLAATATDPEDGIISNSIVWTSDLDGNLGTGATLSTTLSVGVHILTASITDSGGSSASDGVTITVGVAFAATFTFPGGSIFGHQPVPQVDGFDYYFTPLSLDASIVGDGVIVESVEVSAFGQNNGDVINFDWEAHIGPSPFGLPEGQFIQTLIDPVTGYNRIAPTQFRFTIGNQLDDQSYLFSGLHDFTTGSTSANPYFSVVHAAFTSPMTLADGLYAQVFLWTADNRNSKITFDEITLTVRGTGNEVSPPPKVQLQQVFADLAPAPAAPVSLQQAPQDATRWFIVEQAGAIRTFTNDVGATATLTVLDISARVISGGERGLLGMAFHPDFPNTPEVFVSYTGAPDLTSYVSRFSSTDGGQTLDAASEEVILSVPQDFTNHNGGNIVFGPDGYLYIGFGDGGSSGDPLDRAQDNTNLLGTMVRIDVDGGVPYAIPSADPSNPFAANQPCPQGFTVGGQDCPEIFAWGLRNPWRFSFDRQAGDLWVGDVGQNLWEEIDVVTAGGDYGWDDREGAHCFEPQTGCITDSIDPVTEYGRDLGASVTGGFVYRGSTVPDMVGWYVFGDFVSGRLFAIPADSPAGTEPEVLLETGLNIAAFGESVDGELFVVNYGGSIHQVVSAP